MTEAITLPRVVNLYGGPCAGKSTTCYALTGELKYRGYNCELVLEYAKDAAWEKRGTKLFSAQEYIFGKQHFRLSRVASEVDFVITDSPILLGLAYITEGYFLPSLRDTIVEAYRGYECLDVLLKRSGDKPYNPKGRNQDEAGAKALDVSIKDILDDLDVQYHEMIFDRSNVPAIIELMQQRGWL